MPTPRKRTSSQEKLPKIDTQLTVPQTPMNSPSSPPPLDSSTSPKTEKKTGITAEKMINHPFFNSQSTDTAARPEQPQPTHSKK